MLDIDYKNLVTNQEEATRELLEFCGLEWNDKCLEFYKTRRFVGTASYNQVRNPIYKTSIDRWKNYEKYLGPLKAGLIS
jgi:hypothetical protein